MHMQSVKLDGVVDTTATTGEVGETAIVEMAASKESPVQQTTMTESTSKTEPDTESLSAETEIPVEGLAEGVVNLLGDGVGAAVNTGRDITRTLFSASAKKCSGKKRGKKNLEIVNKNKQKHDIGSPSRWFHWISCVKPVLIGEVA